MLCWQYFLYRLRIAKLASTVFPIFPFPRPVLPNNTISEWQPNNYRMLNLLRASNSIHWSYELWEEKYYDEHWVVLWLEKVCWIWEKKQCWILVKFHSTIRKDTHKCLAVNLYGILKILSHPKERLLKITIWNKVFPKSLGYDGTSTSKFL